MSGIEEEIERAAIAWNKANSVECPYGYRNQTARARQIAGWNGRPRLDCSDLSAVPS